MEDAIFELVLTGPAKVAGKFEKSGATVFVGADVRQQLIDAGVVAASAPDIAALQDGASDAAAEFELAVDARAGEIAGAAVEAAVIEALGPVQQERDEAVQLSEQLKADLGLLEDARVAANQRADDAEARVIDLAAELEAATQPDTTQSDEASKATSKKADAKEGKPTASKA